MSTPMKFLKIDLEEDLVEGCQIHFSAVVLADHLSVCQTQALGCDSMCLVFQCPPSGNLPDPLSLSLPGWKPKRA